MAPLKADLRQDIQMKVLHFLSLDVKGFVNLNSLEKIFICLLKS